LLVKQAHGQQKKETFGDYFEFVQKKRIQLSHHLLKKGKGQSFVKKFDYK